MPFERDDIYMIYFDNAATTGHKPQSVINAMNYALEKLNWSEYEAIRKDLQAVKEYLKD